MMNWGWNPRRNTSNSEYGRGVAFASGQQYSNSNYGQHPMHPQMNPTPYFSMDQMQNGGIGFGSGHVHTPSCPHFANNPASGQRYGHYPNCPNAHAGGGDQLVQSYSGGGVYSTGGNSSTDFDVFVGDAAKNVNATAENATSASGSGMATEGALQSQAQGGHDLQGQGQGVCTQMQQPHQHNFGYFIPQNANGSGDNCGPAQQSGASNQQYQTSTGFGLPIDNVGPRVSNIRRRQFPKPQTIGQAPTTPSKSRLCGSCKKCRDLKDSGSAPSLFAPSAIKPPRRPNVNYIPQTKIDQSLARARLPVASPALKSSSSQVKMPSHRSSSIGGFGGRNLGM